MKRILSATIIFILLVIIFPTVMPQKAEAVSWYYDSFEDEISLENWKTINGGSIEISDERYKFESKSLKWAYEKAGILKLTGCSGLGKIKSFEIHRGVKFWIYNKNKNDAEMKVKIGKASAVDHAPAYEFTVNMNFEGWRCIWARINEMAATGKSNDGSDSMQFEMPAEMGKGVVYIDAVDVTDNVNYTACADFQLPYLPLTYTGYQYAAYQRIPESFSETSLLLEHKRAFKMIEKRLDDYILPTDIDYASLDDNDPVKIRYNSYLKRIASSVKNYDGYNIKRREDGSMEGPGLTAVADSMSGSTIGVSAALFEKIWVALALDWKLNKNEESLRKIMDLFDWSHEQGWAEGSAMGAIKFTEIRSVGYVFAVYMMREELKETGRLERELANLRWRSEFGCVFAYDDPDISEFTSVDVDKMRSVVLFQLIYILSMEDSPLKVNYMKAYVEYLQNIIMPRPGTDGGIKNDYTIWHHYAAFMSNYGAEAINTFCQIKYLISDTFFDINESATNVLYKSLETYRASSNTLDMPLRVRGRYPDSNDTMITIAPAYMFLGITGNKEAAEIFLDIWDENHPDVQASYKTDMPSITWLTTLGQLHLLGEAKKSFVKKGYTAAEPMQGTFIYPYGGYAVHRVGNWMMAISGFSKYIWDYEGSPTENFYGRYMNYGSATLIPEDGFIAGGIDSKKGWDWSRWPGVTAKYLSNSELEISGGSGGKGRYYSDETLLGGISSGENGIYAMKLHDTAYDTTFRANKSWFFFGDMIICLGSDIENKDMEHTTETTLFQNVLDDDKPQLNNVDGETISEIPFVKSFDENKKVYLSDAFGNGYIIPDAKGLTIERKRNKSFMQNGIISEGNVLTAYINHGVAPQKKGYEYVVLPQTTPEEVACVMENPGYEVLSKDSFAHIVRNTKDNSLGYVILKSNLKLNYGMVKSVSRPCVIMEKITDDNELSINFSDPDLRVITQGTVEELLTKSELRTVKVTIEGRWKMKNESTSARILSCGKNTVIEFDGVDGKQTDIELVRVK